MAYPPDIRDAAMFPAAPPVAIVAACNLAQDTCSIDSLTLTGHPSAGTSFDAAPGADLAAGTAGRYVMAPLVENFPVAWTLSGHARIRRLRLELYRRGDALACWWKELDYGGGGIAANGSTTFDGDLHNNVHLASNPASVVAVGAALGGNFPLQVMTAEHAPYKLVLRIQEVEAPTRVTCAARWIYLDVQVHDIQLRLQGAAWIPPAGPTYPEQRFRLLTVDTHAALTAQLNPGDLGAAAPANVSVPLTMNVFSRSSKDFYSNAVFAGHKRLFGDGPTLPLEATLRIRRSDGTPAGAQAGASALGGLGVQWDWQSGARPVHPNATAQAFISNALNYKPTEWPHALSNCHADHGGKRNGLSPHFLPLDAGTLGAPADALGAVANRPWAASSQPIADSANANGGKAGILFLPSRIAGDTYRLRIYLGYPNLGAFAVAADAALQTAADNSVSLRSASTLTVRHRVDVARQWRKHNAVDAAGLVWADVRAFLAAACVDLVAPPAPQDITPMHYQAIAGAYFPTMDRAQRLAVAAAGNQHNGHYALTFVDYAAFCVAVRNHGDWLDGQVGAMHFIDDAACRVAQLNAMGLNGINRPNGYHSTDLVLPTRADLQRTSVGRRDALLKTIGISDEDSYKQKCKDWGGDITAALCGWHARIVSTDQPGIHLYHFDFANQWYDYSAAGEAATTISNYLLCPECGTATHTNVEEDGNRDCTNVACGQRLDQSAVVTCYAPFRYMNGQTDAWARRNLSRRQRAIIKAGSWVGTTAAITIAHEIGHTLGMPHAGPKAHLGPFPLASTGGMYPPFHDTADQTCIMSYNFTSAPLLHFCGLCSLRLAGWSMGRSNVATHQTDFVQDQLTLPLSNQGRFNQARTPAPGAAWVTPDPAQCTSCQQPFTTGRRAHHCRLCGDVFCADHSSHTQPVRNPLKADPVSIERVCSQCHLPQPAPPHVPDRSARWEPDENASKCKHPGCTVRFSTTNRIHHCRACGQTYCATHSDFQEPVRYPLLEKGQVSEERVCDGCNALYQ
ncbi:FYVE zinc finger domain-containing protein [Pseudomonas japonica]|uniref:FYVE zinc finger n=1 Tax=Pseudomonas japonica TaxID=256466 RepID=A0A239KKI8_9PSED|nr:FYVE zinc finger domain-containing protein [Pseudomonas japonica]SNT18208.1 FYVE zinc finger [Pseudomonas japonica]